MFKLKSHINDSFFNDVYGRKLDKYQKKVVLDESKELLVIAGAGSGKTLTILAKIKYLIERKDIKENEILCLSFTNEAVNNIKERINYNIDVFTFGRCVEPLRSLVVIIIARIRALPISLVLLFREK